MTKILLDANAFELVKADLSRKFYTTEAVMEEIERWIKAETAPERLDYKSERHALPETPFLRKGFMKQKEEIKKEQKALDSIIEKSIMNYEEFSSMFDSVEVSRKQRKHNHLNTFKDLLYYALDESIEIQLPNIPKKKSRTCETRKKQRGRILRYFREREEIYHTFLDFLDLTIVIDQNKISIKPIRNQSKKLRVIVQNNFDYSALFEKLGGEFNLDKKIQALELKKREYEINAAAFENALTIYGHFKNKGKKRVINEETDSKFEQFGPILTKSLAYEVCKQSENYSLVEQGNVEGLMNQALELFRSRALQLGMYNELSEATYDLKHKEKDVSNKIKIICDEVARYNQVSTKRIIAQFKNGITADLNLISTAYKLPGKVIIFSKDHDLRNLGYYTQKEKITRKLRVCLGKVKVMAPQKEYCKK
jgi:hypothetical protein